MAVEWNSKYEIGFERIDRQHQELFRRFNDLIEACKCCRGRDKIAELVEFLDEYVIYHFSAEEALMAGQGYPQFEEHRRQHQEFVEKIRGWRRHLEEEGATLDLIVDTSESVLRWLITHIRRVDVEVGAFLASRQA